MLSINEGATVVFGDVVEISSVTSSASEFNPGRLTVLDMIVLYYRTMELAHS